MATANQNPFPGFQFPTTTPVPDEVFDVLMYDLTGSELKVLLYICRRTFGFKKASDTISLNQMIHGITTTDGRVLDRGTGLSKVSVITAARSLEKKGIILRVRRHSTEKGDEATAYALNVLAPPPVLKNQTGGCSKIEQGGVQKLDTQQTVKQETEEQETDVVVAKELENFGMSKEAATKLTKQYPAAYIREKLAMAQGLVTAGSDLVSQNPAGWLRRAIEEDYQPARSPKQQHHHQTSQQKKTIPVQTEPQATSEVAGHQDMPREELKPAQTVPTEQRREHAATWQKVIEHIQRDLPQEEGATRLIGTALVEVTDTKATIVVPNRTAGAWIERRLYSQIAKAIKAVVGKELDLQFIAAS
jgi:hypothetical protein